MAIENEKKFEIKLSCNEMSNGKRDHVYCSNNEELVIPLSDDKDSNLTELKKIIKHLTIILINYCIFKDVDNDYDKSIDFNFNTGKVNWHAAVTSKVHDIKSNDLNTMKINIASAIIMLLNMYLQINSSSKSKVDIKKLIYQNFFLDTKSDLIEKAKNRWIDYLIDKFNKDPTRLRFQNGKNKINRGEWVKEFGDPNRDLLFDKNVKDDGKPNQGDDHRRSFKYIILFAFLIIIEDLKEDILGEISHELYSSKGRHFDRTREFVNKLRDIKYETINFLEFKKTLRKIDILLQPTHKLKESVTQNAARLPADGKETQSPRPPPPSPRPGAAGAADAEVESLIAQLSAAEPTPEEAPSAAAESAPLPAAAPAAAAPAAGEAAAAAAEPPSTFKELAKARLDAANTREAYAAHRALLRKYGVANLRGELESAGFVDGEGKLKTADGPFNVYARVAAGADQEQKDKAEAVNAFLNAEEQRQWVVCCNRK